MLNIYDIERTSEIYGPGKRMVIWLQGCLLRCAGCWNQEMWSMEPNQQYSIVDILKMIDENHEIEGITLLGGEPMHQSKELVTLCAEVKARGLTIVLYTGYEIEELNAESALAVIKFADIIISGRYQQELRDIFLQWRGSSNQKIIFNTSHYQDYPVEDGNYVEIVIDKYGGVTYSGFPDTEILKE